MSRREFLWGRRPDAAIHVGDELATGRPFVLSAADFQEKCGHIMGMPGAMKTWLAVSLATQQVQARANVFVFDHKGDLADRVGSAAVALGHPARKTALYDPREVVGGCRRCPGINLFDDPAPASTRAGHFLHVITVLSRERFESKPWLKESGLLTGMLLNLVPPVPGGAWSIFEAAEVAAGSDLGRALLASCQDRTLLTRFAMLKQLRSSEQAVYWGALTNRLTQMRLRPIMAATLGQAKTTAALDFDAMLKPGARALGLFRFFDPDIPDEELNCLAATFFLKFMQAVFRRPKRDRSTPVYLYLDECQRLLMSGIGLEVADALERSRSYGLVPILIHQHASQLVEPGTMDTRVLDAVLEIAQVRAYFRCGRKSADLVWRDVFADQVVGALREIKDEIRQTKTRLREETRTIRSRGHVEGASWGSGAGTVDAFGSTGGDSQQFALDGMFPTPVGTQASTGYAAHTAHQRSRSDGGSSVDITGETVVPFLAPKEYQETTSREYVGLPEAAEGFVARLMLQQKGCFTFKYGDGPAVALRLPAPCPPRVLLRQQRRFTGKVFASYPATDEVLIELEQRVPQFLAAVRQAQAALEAAEEQQYLAEPGGRRDARVTSGEGKPSFMAPPAEPIIDPDAVVPGPCRQRTP